ncbi:7143_t:CDS:2 [Paraglomus occultum]|uniref:7143_t:CDS:1 n=1 Tax=Paraglomus occultum TaxID=144539 RepID=A0A9N9BB74_9GLOM|nr:7143_t:CDS:2 [Paraglomus occultum]
MKAESLKSKESKYAEASINALFQPQQPTQSFVAPVRDAAIAPENLFEVFIEINGRCYFNDSESSNYIPCDNKEEMRAHRMHQVDKVLWGGLQSSPVTEELAFGARVLDVGCGMGVWATNTGSDHPLSTVIGIDNAPAFPKHSLPNVAFLKCNVLDGLPFPDNTFNFVRQAYLVICIDWQRWNDKVLKELVRVTKPGGYIEIMDIDAEIMQPGPIGRMFEKFRHSHVEASGIKTVSSAAMVKAFSELKDEVVVEKFEQKIIPYGHWAGKLGEAALKNYIGLLESMAVFYCPLFNITEAEYKQMIVDYAEE